MIDGSKERKCQLASELQDLRVLKSAVKKKSPKSKMQLKTKIEFVSIFC